MLLITAIRLYQKYRIVNLTVRLAVRLHHRLRPAERGTCPLGGMCSATGLSEARTMGLRALPLIVGRMSTCAGPGGCVSMASKRDRARWWLETWC